MTEPVETKYYDLLGVPYAATQEELRTAYKRKALRLHPDKGGNLDDFRAMKSAYDVLIDPQKRKIYDEYGPAVVDMMGGDMSSPGAVIAALGRVSKRTRLMLVLVLVCVAVCFLSPIIMFSMKWDKKGFWDWWAAFVPLWIVQVIGLTGLACCVSVEKPEGPQESWGEDATAEYEERRLQSLKLRATTALYLLLPSIAELFLALKLQGTMQSSWFIVVLPWVLFELFLLGWRATTSVATFAQTCPRAAAAAASAEGVYQCSAYRWFLVGHVGWNIGRVLTVIFAAAKAEGLLVESWYVAVSPIIISGVICVMVEMSRPVAVDSPRGEADAENQESQNDDQPAERRDVCSVCCSVGAWLFVVLMAAGKLDGGQYTAFLIFAPLFLVVSCVVCCFSCFIFCFSPELVESMQQQEREGFTSNPGTVSAAASYGAVGASPKAGTPAPVFEG